ncbi:uncharacterized protein LAJ45_11117 [Morchella importuna]|uniref:uncharacterized protein n=1 Tax=Morchella importuna TaxID=1174673 RepID=UPI001E8E9CEA|nr:uncharacterized protein LAJ45_11117 [Morchella importuna]KAH8144847.1 hypothetical protein LAJ45_11117 [Morchella importuna]
MGIVLSKLRKIFNRKPAESLSAHGLHTLENGPPEEPTYVPTTINEPNTTTAATTPLLILAGPSASEPTIESFPTTRAVPSQFVSAQICSLVIDDIGVTARTLDTPAAEPDEISPRCSTAPPDSEPIMEPTQSEDMNQLVGYNPRSDTTCSASKKAVTSVMVDGSPSAPTRAQRRGMTSTLWGQAVEEVRKEYPEQLEEKKDADFNLATSLIGYVEDQRTKIDKSRLYYTNSKKEKVYYAEIFLTQLGKYATIGDIAIQHHPDVVALAWSGFRLLLDFGLAYYKRMALISSSLGYLGWVIRCCEIYEALYGGAEYSSITDLKKTLVDQYVSILRYLIYAKLHVNKSTKGNYLINLLYTLFLTFK